MHSRQSLEFRHHQQLALTPQLQQSIRFLQLSGHDLEKEIAEALLENPLLEPVEEYDINAVSTIPMAPHEFSESWPAAAGSGSAHQDGDPVRPEARQVETLRQHLLQQLHSTRAPDRDRALVTVLIEELDENGYLPTSLDDMAASLPAELGVSADDMRPALSLLQSFDPAGVGAKSAVDCLLLQLRRPDASRAVAQASPAVRRCAAELLERHLDVLASGNLSRLRDQVSCSGETLEAAHCLLLRLNPQPGLAWGDVQADYVNPDVLVRKTRGRWRAALNPAVLPRLRVNPVYEQLLRDSNEQGPLRAQMQYAHGLIRSVGQRFITILRVAQAIVDRQQLFFEQGMRAMRPLVLRDIAEALDMHESTVSRATRQKYVQTRWGVIELKQFFGTSLATTGTGEATSASAVRSLIMELIAEEPRAKPLSDDKITRKLNEQGVVIARRTVAKYREAAGIKTASLRKARAALDGRRP